MNRVAEQIYRREGRVVEVAADAVVYNLGAGEKRYPGVIGVDRYKGKAVDIVHDLDVSPWPIQDDSADLVLGFQSFEHFTDLVAVMDEVYRICKHGARVIIEVPYFRHIGAYQDPTHKHFFTGGTIAYFHETAKRQVGVYSPNVHFQHIGTWYGWPAPSSNPLLRSWKRFIQRHTKWFDMSVCSMFFPPQILVYELEVVKGS